ncbi:ABC efflux pump, inner membrane subunit [Candidatus Koribacter versatilis Ellin345]|uniref:ABC efflux pump, inner membrane subunit n=1 Tax=Koribacter versatilis (strain Ellin345) TaxID=204669 RepID=Q1IS63_KORVE|nr:ABC transporter permease [Candidatus Koribacter versatilis]ABF40287.1 ABC efflux pump, inner membrane subunit [Candidatus Koribacter versatilis Ellin345]
MPDFRELVRGCLQELRLPGPREAEIVEEVAQHLSDRYDGLRSMNVPEAEALRTIEAELGARDLANEFKQVERMGTETVALGSGGGRPWTGLRQDLRYAVRALRASPIFSAVCIASLALGIGANTAIFQLLDAVRMRLLPVRNPQELAMIRPTNLGRTGHGAGDFSYMTNGLWMQVKQQQQGFSDVFAFGGWPTFNLANGGEARYAHGLWVSGEFFDALGVQPLLGRVLHAPDDHPGCGVVGAVISYPFWQREYGGDMNVVGRTVRLEGHPFPILGVTPASFYGMEIGRQFDVAVPLCSEPVINGEDNFYNMPRGWWLTVMGRLKPGWTFAKASAQLNAISASAFRETLPPQFQADTAKQYLGKKLAAYPAANGVSELREKYETPLWLLLAIAGSVLLIACANLANLMLARASSREREIAVRMALGAERVRILRQLLVESLLLASGGAVFGLLLAFGLSRLLVRYLGQTLFVNLAVDWRVLGFGAGLAMLTACLFGLGPAIRATKASPARLMNSSGRGQSATRERVSLRKVLVASQVAVSLVLVAGALLFSGSLRRILAQDAGFRRDGVLVMMMDFSSLQLPTEARLPLKRTLLERVRAVPGIESAAEVMFGPFMGNGWNDRIVVDGKKQETTSIEDTITEGYFQTMQTPLLMGRDFDAQDTATSQPVAIVNQKFAKVLLGTNNPIGRTFKVEVYVGERQPEWVVVGMVKDSKFDDMRDEFEPMAYYPQSQNRSDRPDTEVVVRSQLDPASLMASLRRVSADVNPGITLEFHDLRREIENSLLRERLLATLSGFFGVLAILLAAIGLYGVIAYGVARRTNEIGIRMALGAIRWHIVRMIVSEALALTVTGAVFGVALTVIVARSAASLLYGLTAHDPLMLTAAAVALLAVCLIASAIPAIRAARLDPMTALREE